MHTGRFPDPVTITLPNGTQVAFALAQHGWNADGAWAAVIKDAGDDPDVTHGAMIRADLRHLPKNSGILFRAGEGVGTITRPGLPLPPGEPAINPVPRSMIQQALTDITGPLTDAEVRISIPGGEALASRTLNGRLGIVGGLSILGTTGIVVPFSCSAWIDSIRRGIDVARAMNIPHLAAATGDVSERAVQQLYGLPDTALIEMGDFAGGVLKYIRDHPVPRLTIAGGLAKMTKLAQGRLDLHSRRGLTDMNALAGLASHAGATPVITARIGRMQTVAEAFLLCAEHDIPLGNHIARMAHATAKDVLGNSPTEIEILLFDRSGVCRGRSHPDWDHDLKRR